MKPSGTCRLCLVDVLRNNPNRGKPVVSCATEAQDGMVVVTNSDEMKAHIHQQVFMMRRRHPDLCQTCAANGHCEFQDLIGRYNVKKPEYVNPRVKPSLEREGVAHKEDRSSPAIDLDFSMCVLCLRCVRACSENQGMNILGVVARGNDEVVAPLYSLKLKDTECISCGACVAACPVAAITEKNAVNDVLHLLESSMDYSGLAVDDHNSPKEFNENMLHSKKFVTVVQTAPAVRVTISEEFGLPPGSISTGQLVRALKMLGFDYVFDTNFTADLTIIEEANELLKRIQNNGPFPMFTSCCPAWVNMVEKVYPQLIPNLSSCKSPQQMFGSLAKSYFADKIGRDATQIKVVSVMPCVAKKDEASRKELVNTVSNTADVDYVLTTRELARMIRMHRPKIFFAALEEEQYDSPLGESSGAGLLFGATGGVMEAALRTAYAVTSPDSSSKSVPGRLRFEEVRGLEGIRRATVDLHGVPLNVAIANQGANIRKLVEMIEEGKINDLHFVEMMACKGGCIGGAGNPKDAVDVNLLEKRVAAIYRGDEAKVIRMSHENPEIQQIYKDFLGEPLGTKSHLLLHTKYSPRDTVQSAFQRAENLTSAEALEKHLRV
uniref:Ferredoxin n=1 Tax=Timspurckia oligopyrenoides TaxID=708627 RepID=A0A7S0ZII5_9RHOD